MISTLPGETFKAMQSSLAPLLIFEEHEGTTLILAKKEADARTLPYTGVWSRITLAVNSDLAAVGFLAAITAKLAAANIPVNAVSAFHHDHLFVPQESAEKAMSKLQELSAAT